MLKRVKKAQTAVEYMLLMAIVIGVVLIALPSQLPRVYNSANIYFDKSANAIFGRPPDCGDGVCDNTIAEDNESCCDDCGGC